MPTGYTYALDEHPDMSTKQWIMEHLVRAFGICVTLREEDPYLTEEQIKQKLTENSSIKYHEAELKKAQILVKEFDSRTEQEWKSLWEQSEIERKKDNKERIAKGRCLAQRHKKVREDLQTIINTPNTNEITKNIAKFGIQQLDLVQHDTEPYIIGPSSLKEFKEDAVKSAKRDVETYIRELEAEKERTADRLASYERLKEDVDRALFSERFWNVKNAKPKEVSP